LHYLSLGGRMPGESGRKPVRSGNQKFESSRLKAAQANHIAENVRLGSI